MQARDVVAVGDDDDRAARPVVLAEIVRRGDDRVVQRGACLAVDGHARELVACLGRAGGAAGQRDGVVAEGNDADVVLGADRTGEGLGGRDGVGERLSAHRLRAVEREHDALRPAEVDGGERRDGLTVLTQGRRLRTERRHDRDAQLGEGARVEGADARCRPRRRDEHRADGEGGEERALHSWPPTKPDAANDARTWSESSPEKNDGGSTTLFAASRSRK